MRAGVHTDALLAWAEAPEILSPRWLRWIARLFTAAVLVSIGLSVAISEPRPFFGMLIPDLRLSFVILIAQSLFTWPQRQRLEHVLHAAGAAARDLDVLAHLLERLEQEQFQAPRLVGLREQLHTEGVEASRAIRALHRLVEMHEWQHNLLFLILSLPLMLGTHLAWAIEDWRRRYGRHIRLWLAAAGDFEALASLSAYRYEHPDDPFPEIVATRPRSKDGALRGHVARPPAAARRADGAERRPARPGTCSCSSSAARTCPARARCCGRSASTRCWRLPARRCARRR